MKKYLQVAKNTFDETIAYRTSFIIYRVRGLLGILTLYFLWLAVLPQGQTFLGYSQSMMLTYVLGISLLSSIVLATRSQSIAVDINEGNLSNYLLKPISFFRFHFARDLGDKLMNLFFAVIELSLLFLILKPPLFFQTDVVYLSFFAISVILASILYFYFSLLFGFFGFWSNEVWGPRFIFYQLLTFFAGGLFPLDILPQSVFNAIEFLPFTYLIYFPIKVYMGDVSLLTVFKGLIVTSLWIVCMYYLTSYIWRKGLRSYTAHGR